MITRRFELTVAGTDLARAVELARPYAGRTAPVRVRLRPGRDGRLRLTARVPTHEITSFGGSYVPNGTLRGTLEDTGVGPGAGVRISGRIRWGGLTYVVSLMVAVAVFILWVEVSTEGPTVAWTLAVPLLVGGVNLRRLVGLRRSDPERLATHLSRVLRGEDVRDVTSLHALERRHPDLGAAVERLDEPPSA